MYEIYINLGCTFEFRTQKLPYERISVNFSSFIDFGHQVHFWILAVFQNVLDLHNFSEHKNYPMKEFRAVFPISSISAIRSAYVKQIHFSILAVFQNLWDLHKFGLQIWIQNAKFTLWKNFGIFYRFHGFWSSGLRMRNKFISQY